MISLNLCRGLLGGYYMYAQGRQERLLSNTVALLMMPKAPTYIVTEACPYWSMQL